MQNLAVPQVNAVMSDSLFGFVDSGIIGTFASFIRHKEHDVSRLQVSPIRCCFSNFFNIFGLCPGIAWKNDAGAFFKRLSDKVRTVERPGIGTAGTKFIWRSQIFHTGLDYAFGRAGGGLRHFDGCVASYGDVAALCSDVPDFPVIILDFVPIWVYPLQDFHMFALLQITNAIALQGWLVPKIDALLDHGIIFGRESEV